MGSHRLSLDKVRAYLVTSVLEKKKVRTLWERQANQAAKCWPVSVKKDRNVLN